MWEWKTIMTVDHTKWHTLRYKDVSVQGLTRYFFCKAQPSHPERSWQQWGSNPSAWCTWSSVRSEHRSKYKSTEYLCQNYKSECHATCQEHVSEHFSPKSEQELSD